MKQMKFPIFTHCQIVCLHTFWVLPSSIKRIACLFSWGTFVLLRQDSYLVMSRMGLNQTLETNYAMLLSFMVGCSRMQCYPQQNRISPIMSLPQLFRGPVWVHLSMLERKTVTGYSVVHFCMNPATLASAFQQGQRCDHGCGRSNTLFFTK